MVNDGIILYEYLKKPKEAKALFEKSLKLINGKNTHLTAQINYHIGVTLLAMHQPHDAKNMFIAAIRETQDKLNLISYASQSYRRYNEAGHLHVLFQELTQETRPSGMIFALLGETQSERPTSARNCLTFFCKRDYFGTPIVAIITMGWG